MRSKEFFQFVLKELEQGFGVGVFVVAHSQGSSPGRQGFKMALSQSGEIMGTVGGGIMEKQILDSHAFSKRSAELMTLSHNQDVSTGKPSGLICSGNQTILIFNFFPEMKEKVKRALSESLGFSISNTGFEFTSDGFKANKFNFSHLDHWQYIEKFESHLKLMIFGGGHIGLALSQVASLLDFDTTVFDERENLYTLKKNDSATRIISEDIEPYLKQTLSEDFEFFAVVVSRSYQTDFQYLKILSQYCLPYVGLMGSLAKIQKIKSELKHANVSEKFITKIHTPIGIDISAKTPMEIAISICAQLIKVSNSFQSTP